MRAFRVWVAIMVCCCGMASYASDVDLLVKDLKSADNAARARARQLLPHEGVAALNALLPILASEDQPLRANAINVIADIANGAAALGGEAQTEAASQLIALLTPEQSTLVKLQLLRLLPIVVPEGFNVAPIAQILGDAALREKAREALVQINTYTASDALIAALPQADPAFAVALLDGLGAMQKLAGHADASTLNAAINADAGVRAAAIRAVAHSGDPQFLDAAYKVVKQATPETAFAAEDALLRLADGMAAQGGNWDRAIAVYQYLLQNSKSGPICSAALMGLGRNGDVTVVDTIIKAASRNAMLEETSVRALTSLEGKEAVSAIVAAFPSLPEGTRLGLLEWWGQNPQPLGAGAAQATLESAQGPLRVAALRALSSGGSADAAPALVKVIQSGTDEERVIALQAMARLADSTEVGGNKEGAAQAYVQLYGLSNDPNIQRAALRGIARNPSPAAYDVAQEAFQNAALKAEGTEALISVATALSQAGDFAKANEAVSLILQADASPEMLVRLATQLQGLNNPTLTNVLGSVKKWNVIGPFAWKEDSAWETAFVGEPNVNVSAQAKSGDTALNWKEVTTPSVTGLVDLASELGMRDRCFGYAYAEVDVAEEADGQIRLGSDDGNQVWFNGNKIWENRVDRGAALDQDKVNAHFKKGRNTILVKVSQGGGGWNFNLRLAGANGVGVAFTQP